MRRRVTFVLCLLTALAGCRGSAGEALTAEPRVLAADDPHRTHLGAVEVLSIHQLHSGVRWFGGISGLSFDGAVATAINDAGHWLRFRMQVDEAGRPVSFTGMEVAPLGGLDGSKEDGDAEEIAATPDGWVVSFERRHRLLRYGGDLSGAPERLAPPDSYGDQPENGGVEAVARLRDGRLLLLSEDGEDERGLGLAWIGRPGAWQRLSWHRSGQFHATAAAALPGGDVLVLERRFSLIGGVTSRLVRLPAADLRPGVVMRGQELFTLEPPLLVDNYEGLAVHARKDGRVVAYLVSDDNFSPLQATLLMAILLPE